MIESYVRWPTAGVMIARNSDNFSYSDVSKDLHSTVEEAIEVLNKIKLNGNPLHNESMGDVEFPIEMWIVVNGQRLDMDTERGKTAPNRKRAFEVQQKYAQKPHGWVQWKGTDVCMDVHCKCGAHLHIDAAFVYNVKCMECGTPYSVNGHVELIELTGDVSDLDLKELYDEH